MFRSLRGESFVACLFPRIVVLLVAHSRWKQYDCPF